MEIFRVAWFVKECLDIEPPAGQTDSMDKGRPRVSGLTTLPCLVALQLYLALIWLVTDSARLFAADFSAKVLNREFTTADIQRIAEIAGQAQVDRLRELLAGELSDSGQNLEDLIFVKEDKFRASLRALVSDANVGPTAGGLLAFIGVPEDIRLFLDHAPPPKAGSFANRWAYGVVTALLEPSTEKEWAFLRRCATNGYDDFWVDAGAIRTLKLIASQKSRQLLYEVGQINKGRTDSVRAAIQYIDSAPVSLSDEDLIAAGKKVAQAIRIGKWKGNHSPQYCEQGDKALIACEFRAGRDLLIHTATFHKVGGTWRLRGVRETLQALLADDAETDPKSKVDK